MKICRVSVLLLLVISLVKAGAPNNVRTTSSRCKWVGTFSETRATYSPQVKETIHANLTFELNPDTTTGIQYILTLGHIDWSISGTDDGGCSWTGSYEFDISEDSGDGGSLSTLYGYGFGVAFYSRTEFHNLSLVEQHCTGYTLHWNPQLYGFTVYVDTAQVTDAIRGSSTDNVAGYIDTKEWNLMLSGPDTRLVIESDSYESWIPAASKYRFVTGTPLVFDAKLEEADGSLACSSADSFRFELVDVSHEKGIACNYPEAGSADETPDLNFDDRFVDNILSISSDSLTVVTGYGKRASAGMLSHDWGGYAKLKVTAFLTSGKQVEGYLRGQEGVTETPIPKRTGSSKIADMWKNSHGVSGLSDDDDAEDIPAGDGDAGDGFTLYEEYRGFYENGRHIYGDPKRKDLFIYKSIDDFIPGISKFKTVTGLNVHFLLNSDEFNPANRVMNFNHTSGPHQGFDQHGLWIQRGGAGNSHTTDLGPPKYVDEIVITDEVFAFANPAAGSGGTSLELTKAVAHELGHGARIQHHGDSDPRERTYKSVFTFDFGRGIVNLDVTEDGALVLPSWENGTAYTRAIDGVRYIAAWAGEHSGVENCIMRYACAFAYIPGVDGTSIDRYLCIPKEKSGLKLCDKQEDNQGGVNFAGRLPRPRYGPAALGNCKSQICVSDKYH